MDIQELSWKQRGRLWFRLSIRIIIAIILVVLTLSFGRRIISLFMPFILALLVAMAINPLIQKIQKRFKFKRSLISIVLIMSLFIATLILSWIIASSVARELLSLLNGWEELFKSFEASLSALESFITSTCTKLHIDIKMPDNGILGALTSQLFNYLKELSTDVSSITAFARDKVLGLTSFGVSLLIFIMGCYFITEDYPNICSRFAGKIGEELTKLLNQVKAITIAAFGGYLKARALVATGVAIIIFIGFLMLKQDYVVILSIFMGILDFIPIIGSGTVLVPWSIIDFALGNFSHGLALLGIYSVITIYRNIAEPKLVGDHVGLSPTLSLITIYIGMRMYGVIGMILGPVLTLVVINSLKIGVLKDTRDDIKMAIWDIVAILRNRT